MSVTPERPRLPGESLAPGTRTGGRRIHSDFVIAILIVAFCALIYTVTMTFPSVPAMLAMGMGPEVFPRLLLGLMVVLAGLLAVLARGKADEVREPVPPTVYWTALAIVAFMGVLWLLGMAIAMFVGFVGMGLLWGERRWLVLVISGLALSALIYTLFVRGFGIPLPQGIVGEWLF
jgi:putative tricarboxylic transport membrane protein